MISLVNKENAPQFQINMAEKYKNATGIDPVFYVVQTGDGAFAINFDDLDPKADAYAKRD